MAYRRYAARRRTTRRPARRPARRTRTRYRRTTTRRKTMTRKRILNITSDKKQDNMAPVSYTPTGLSPTQGGYLLPGDTTQFMIWCPTFRERNTLVDPNSRASREDDTVYMRGLREMITFNTRGVGPTGHAAAWLWRRVVFSAKGLWQQLGTSVEHSFTSSGYVRFLANHNGTTFASYVADNLFRGRVNVDWTDVITAKTDTTRFNIMHDQVVRLNPNSSARQYWKYKRWHSFNKNLVYNNDEDGPGEVAFGYSTSGKPGMGDVYVVDMFTCATQNVADTLYFTPEATLYWHEK